MVLQGPISFRSNASKLRSEPWYRVISCGFLGTTPETPKSLGSFLDQEMQFRGCGPDCSEVEFETPASQRLKNDTSAQNGSCRLTFGYCTRTV